MNRINLYNAIPEHGPYIVTRDGVPLSPIFESQSAAFAWLHDYQPASVHHAIAHEGYEIVNPTQTN
jgi:hypothetical protein